MQILNYNQLSKIFRVLPAPAMLAVAKKTQQQIVKNPELIKYKDDHEVITDADLTVERIVLDYFAASPMRDTYMVMSEEQARETKATETEKTWQLLVDPLDGSAEFAKGGAKWGVMVGAADLTGKIIFSWNLISTGKIFTSEEDLPTLALKPFADKIAKEQKLIIDVFDYGAGTDKKIGHEIEKAFSLSPNQYQLTSEPSAVWAGFKLWRGFSDGLLWLPSAKGKQSYPDYDLIFLGALAKAGYAIRLGKTDSIIKLAAIAPADSDVEKLYAAGLNLIPKNIKLEKMSELLITNPLI